MHDVVDKLMKKANPVWQVIVLPQLNLEF